MDKYEISLWEDYPDLTSDNIPFLNERKLCVIGSDTMTSAARALEPKLVSNVNGTNTFTFRIYYRYNDEITGEELINPYLPYIINERKVKVLWKDVWYDLVIKKIEEDTLKRSVLCTCEDLFISELSKNGYELEFNSELQNNSGTASLLVEKVLEGSGWRLGNLPNIILYKEESAYEVKVLNSFSAEIVPKPLTHEGFIFSEEEPCLLLTSCLNVNSTEIYFYYTGSDGYLVEEGTSIVTGGLLYSFSGRVELNELDEDGNKQIIFSIFNEYNVKVFELNLSDYTSSIYKVKRPVTSLVTVFDKLLNRYVDAYFNPSNGDPIYGYETTEYTDPSMVVNLIANPKDFKDTNGWIGDEIQWEIYPLFDKNTNILGYNAKSYLKITEGNTYYNTALISNRQYLEPSSTDIREGKLGGFQVGETYIFRYRAFKSKSDIDNNKISGGLTAKIYELDDKDKTKKALNSPNYFGELTSESGDKYIDSNGKEWGQFEIRCRLACPVTTFNSLGLFIEYSGNTLFEDDNDSEGENSRWLEEVLFFKKVEGKDENGETVILEPEKFNGQSVVKTIYKYYNPEQLDENGKQIEDPKDLVFLYQGEEKLDIYTPVMTNLKITSIEISKSNRFNILLTIAEKFECWIRFVINHDQLTGLILYDENGLPLKYVKLVELIGEDTGISFEYGIDLKGIKRTIVSNTIATKAIIIPNENEFGKNGFCTIARSKLNYCRENFILNFDYYILQGLLNRDAIESDLYKTNGTNLGYYYYLNKFNREYDKLADAVNAKLILLIKQEAEYKVQNDNLRAALEKLTNSKSDLQILAGVGSFEEAQSYAGSHASNTRVQSLMRTIAELNNTISNLRISVDSLEISIDTLKNYIEDGSARMKTLTENITNLHRGFFKKYSRFIQEGTWQDQNYVDDDKYYLDALEVAYRSSRPQIQYDISLVRLSGLEDFSSKKFDLGDICYVQDTEFFGYADESKTTPYKQKIIISLLTSFFDTPEKDIIKVQNYKTQFDDLFQRITTATLALQFSQGKYERAAEVVNPDKTLSFALLQDTFDYNKDLVLNSANQLVVWDNTGITVTDSADSALKVKIMAGGIFASSDGGNTWKNALRGDGISTDLLTAGRINTSEIYVYDGKAPSFRWDSEGINAYYQDIRINSETSLAEVLSTSFNKFVRFDKFGLYGYDGGNESEEFAPATEEAIWDEDKVKFGLTWKGFFLRNISGDSSIEISSDNDILIKTGLVNRIQIGDYKDGYGILINDSDGEAVFKVDTTKNTNSIGGWTLTKNSFQCTKDNNTIGLYSVPLNATINNNTDNYYIIAGENFGVTIDGKIYASAGKIGDCEIVGGKLTIGSNKLEDMVLSSSSEIEYCLSDSSTELLNSTPWSTAVPTSDELGSDKYVWTRAKVTVTKVNGDSETKYRPDEYGEYDLNLTERLRNIQNTSNAASDAVYRTLTIFYSIRNNESLPSKKGTWVDEEPIEVSDPNDPENDPEKKRKIKSGEQGKWTQIRPIYNSDYPALYIATLTQTIELHNEATAGEDGKIRGACNCTTPKLDVTTTVIDGSHITTGLIDANRINVEDLSAFNATIAGWKFTTDGLYNVETGTHLNSGNYGENTGIYTIDTDSLRARGGEIGGCTVNSSGISGNNWNLSSAGGTIGGWTIIQNGIFSLPLNGYLTLLDSSGALHFLHDGKIAKVFEFSSGIVGIDPDLHVNGIITAGNTIRSNSNVTAPTFIFPAPTESEQPITLDRTDAQNIKELNKKLNNDTTNFDDTHLEYLKWLHNNWKHITPQDVGL